MHEAALRIAVVGHTNTGKTSLLRTLTRDTGFGEVADSPSTTRHVEGAALLLEGRVAVELFDTPGMEDAIALLEYIERLCPPDERLDGPQRIERFLATREARQRFEQEAKVLRQMLASDAAFYVVDARDPVLGKHRDELRLLADCARPLLPVLNFVRDPANRIPAWREALARLGLHAVVEFDTVAPARDGEQRLYEKLATLLDARAATLRALVDEHARQREQRRQDAARIVAGLLIDVAALRLPTPPDADAVEAGAAELRDRVRRHERKASDDLLALYGFRRSDLAEHDLPQWQARLSMDLFQPEALRDMGVQLGKGVAAGAAAGAAVDLLTGGLSLGAGTLVGATVGGVWQSAERLGQRLLGKLRGWRELTVDDGILRLLALRQQLLVRSLEERGHAAWRPVQLNTPADDALRHAELPAELREARAHPDWSAIAPKHEASPRRQTAIQTLARHLVQGWNEAAAPTPPARLPPPLS